MSSEVEESLKRIQQLKGVVGTIIINSEGIPVKTTLDDDTTRHYAGLMHELTSKAKSTIKSLDSTNDLTFVRMRTKKHDIMASQEKGYVLIVVQTPQEET